MRAVGVVLCAGLVCLAGCRASPGGSGPTTSASAWLGAGTPSAARASGAGPASTAESLPDTRRYPYPVPASCRATPTSGHETRERLPAWWLDGHGISVGSPVGVLYQGDNKLYWTWNTAVSSFKLTGGLAGEPAATVRLLAGGPLSGGPSSVRFSAPGCWRIRAEGDGQALDATVYVYPWACLPDNMRTGAPPPSPEPCAPPPIA